MNPKSHTVMNIGKSSARRKPPQHITTIASSVALSHEQYRKTLGLDDASLKRIAGLKQESLNDRYSRIPIKLLATAFEISARQSNDPLLGLHFGEWYKPVVIYAFHCAITCAPDLRRALMSVQDHRCLVAGMPAQISDLGALTEFSWLINLTSSSSRHVIDFITMRTLHHIQRAIGPEWKPIRVGLTYEKPENMNELFRVFGPNIYFDQPKNSVWIDSASMATPMPEANLDMYHIALNSFRNPFADERDDKDLVDQSRRFIRAQLGKNSVTMTSTSKHMRMTPQQLRRHLKKHGTSFQSLLDEARKGHATHYLFETDIQLCEITYLLGFSDQSTFTRAAKRWFGETPKNARLNSKQN